jgi:MFS transporter, DHA1 family, tetracycline resistance protein
MNPSLILIMVSLVTWGIGEGMFILFVPLYLQEMGANPLTIGSILGFFGLMMMVMHIPAGYLSDRFGRRPLLVIAWFIGALAAWIMALAPSLWPFVVGYLLYGLTAFVSSPLFSYVTAARGSLTTGRAMTLTSAMFNLGAVLGPVTGGWVGDVYGFRAIFLTAACIFLVSVGVIIFIRPQATDKHDDQSSLDGLLKNPRFTTFLAILFMATFVMFLPQPLTPNFLQNERGISLGSMGWIGSAGGIGNVAFNLLLGRMNPRLGFLLGQACVGLFALLLWKGGSLPWYAVGYFLLGGFRAARVLAFAQIRLLVHQARMGLAYGIAEAVNALAMILSPLLAGYLYDRSPASIYPISLALLVFVLFICSTFAPRENMPADVQTVLTND